MRYPRLVQVGQGRTGAAKELKYVRDIRQSEPRQTRPNSLSRNPPAQVPGPPPHVRVRGPVMVRRRNGRVAPMPQLPRFLEEPGGMRWVRCSDERKRSP